MLKQNSSSHEDLTHLFNNNVAELETLIISWIFLVGLLFDFNSYLGYLEFVNIMDSKNNKELTNHFFNTMKDYFNIAW